MSYSIHITQQQLLGLAQTMNQNQCVPDWNLDDVGPNPPPPPPREATTRSHSTSKSTAHDTSLLDYEVAELTWENGQLAMHGLGLPRVPSKSNLGDACTEKQSARASGTLECIVNQAISKPQPAPTFHVGACKKDEVLMPRFDQCVGDVAASGPMASVSMTLDALVPTANTSHNTRVGSCSMAAAARVPVDSDWSVSLSGSTRRERLKRPIEDTCKIVGGDLTNGLTSTSFGTSPENTKTVTVNDRDSVCRSRPQMERMDEEENGNKASGKSTKRIRAAAIHNQSERTRRDKINQRMKTLQNLVPNSSKTDKASMLDEVIDYLKQLQAQVKMMSRMSMPTSMMMQMAAIQQHLQMSMRSPMGIGMSMDKMNMGVNNPMALARSNTHGVGHATILNNPSNFMSSPMLATWDGGPSTAANGIGAVADRLPSQPRAVMPADPFSAAFFGCQSQPMTMDTYSRMAAMFQQLQQLQQPQGP